MRSLPPLLVASLLVCASCSDGPDPSASGAGVLAELESGPSHFEFTLLDSGVTCGETVELQLEMAADGVPARSTSFDFVLGEKERAYERIDGAALTRFITTPVLSNFVLTDDTAIGDLDISVSITHSVPSDLIVELSSPAGTTVRLHDRSAGSGGQAQGPQEHEQAAGAFRAAGGPRLGL